MLLEDVYKGNDNKGQITIIDTDGMINRQQTLDALSLSTRIILLSMHFKLDKLYQTA